jgi:tetratricopeptide (TPR) repeat protein
MDIRKALEFAGEAVKRDGSHVPALATLAFLLPLAGDVEGGLARASELERIYDSPGYWIRYKMMTLYSLERFEEALVECDKNLEESPGERESHLTRARILRRLKRHKEAVEEFTRAIELSTAEGPSPVWLHYHRGTLLWMLGREEQAISDYRKAYRTMSQASYPNIRMFLIRQHTGKHDEANKILQEARNNLGEDPWIGSILSCLAGELTPAELVAAARGPVQQCEAYYYAGEVCLIRGQDDAAEKWFRACIDTGLKSDPSEFWEPMSEYELALWRLSL